MSEWQPQEYDPRLQRQRRTEWGQQPPWEDEYAAAPQHVPPQFRGQPYYDYAPGPQYQPPAPRRRWIYLLWAVGAVALLAGSAGATVAIRHHTAAAAKPLTCKQQYANWKNGAAHAPAKNLVNTLKAIQSTGANEDIPADLASIKKLVPAATALQAYPMPACADPKGYWPKILTELKAAGDNAGTASGLGGLLVAEEPLKKVPPLETKLNAELAKTAGVKPS